MRIERQEFEDTMLFNLEGLASFLAPVMTAVGQPMRLTGGVPEVLILLWWGGSLLALARRARIARATEAAR